MSDKFVQLKDNGDNLFPKSCIIVPDFNNILFTYGDYKSGLTIPNVPQDCIVATSNVFHNVKINGNDFLRYYNHAAGWYPLKKGDTIYFSYVMSEGSSFGARGFGLRYI